MRIRRKLRNGLSMLTALASATGCVRSWQPQDASPEQVLETTGATSVQVRLRNGLKVEIRDPAVRNDSVVGWQWRAGKDTTITTPWGAPVSDVASIATLRNNVGANVGIGVVVGAAVFFASIIGAYIAVCGGGGCD